MAALVKRGWDNLDSNAGAAKTSFRQALDKQPAHAEANYGYGYLLLQEGNASGARSYLCKAMTSSDVDTRNEVTGVMGAANLSCD